MNRKVTVMQLGSPAGLYGAERWILALVRHLDPRKVTTIVSAVKDAPDLEVPLCREAEKLGFRTEIFSCPGRINPRAISILARYLKEQRVDILHTHGYKQDLIGLLAARLAGCKVVSTPHGWSRDAGMALTCYEGLNRLAFPFFDAVAPLSTELFEPLKRIPAMTSRLIYIPNGVDTDEIDNHQGVAGEILDWKKEDAFVIGYIGQLIPRKGLHTLIAAAAGLDPGLNFKMALVGDGPQRGELEALARELGLWDKIRFFGFRDDRLAFLKGFDLFVLPSNLEGIPRCLMEAMAAGIPVLASDIPGTRQLVGNDAYGRLFSPGNTGELQGLLDQSIGRHGEMRIALASARQLIHTKFSARRMADRYGRLFEALTAGSALRK